MFKTINGGKMPQRGSKYSACVDLFASEDCTIGAGKTKAIGLGVCIDLDIITKSKLVGDYCKRNSDDYFSYDNALVLSLKSHYLLLEPRSSLRAKGLIIGNGIIDLDFIQEIKMIIHNPITEDNFNIDDNKYIKDAFIDTCFQIKKGDKIAQITLLEHKSYLFGIDTEEERTGGIGSTGL